MAGQKRQSRSGGNKTAAKGSTKRKVSKKPPPRRSWVRRIVVWSIKLGLLVAVLGTLGLTGVFWYYGRDLPSVAQLRDYRPPQTTRILDRNGELIGEVFDERRTVVPMDRIPRVLVLSVLAAEDADFYHWSCM